MNKYGICALLAGACWGCTGLFTRFLAAQGLNSFEMLVIRCGVAAICFGIWILCKDAKQFRVKAKDIWLFLAVGLVGQTLFGYCYYTAITIMSVSTACILLYLSPALVVIIAHFVFGDKVGKRGVISVILCVLGCACVSGFGGSVTVRGLFLGLGSALAFALINIFDRMLLERGYTSATVNFYLCLIAAVGGAVLSTFSNPVAVMFSGAKSFAMSAACGIVTCFLAYLFFSYALRHCESGKVSIFASTEPVVATLISILVFREPFGILSVIGIILVLGSIVLMNTGSSES